MSTEASLSSIGEKEFTSWSVLRKSTSRKSFPASLPFFSQERRCERGIERAVVSG